MKETIIEKVKCASSSAKDVLSGLKNFSVSLKGNARVSLNDTGKEKGAVEFIEDGVTINAVDILKAVGIVVAVGAVISAIRDLLD